MAFSGPARAIAYGPHTGNFSMVLQWKRARGRTGHMINTIINQSARVFSLSYFLKIYACCFVVVLRALLRPCEQNSDCQHISVLKRFHESTLETRSNGTGPFDNLKFSAFFTLSPTKIPCETWLIPLGIKTSHVYRTHLLLLIVQDSWSTTPLPSTFKLDLHKP